jgi:hypothetical protein
MASILQKLYFSPLGGTALFSSSEPWVLDAVDAAYADWPARGPGGDPRLEIHLEVRDEARSDAAVEIRVQGSRLALDGGAQGWADAASMRAACAAPRGVFEDPYRLAAEILDPLLLFLLARSGRAPVHAAGVVIGDRALALAGPSGSGKSTLALAAMERGLKILSDDTLYIQLRPHFRVWGVRRPLHVFPQDAPRFTGAVRLRGGKLKTAAPMAPEAAQPFADRAALVVLQRGAVLGLAELDPEEAISSLGPLEPGFDLLPEESAEALRALARGGAWRLTLTHDPRAAVDLLCERLSGSAPIG